MTEKIIEAYRSAGRRILLLDYDGTIVPFRDDPEQAGMDENTRSVISSLATTKGNRIIVISGRTIAFLEKQFANIPVDLIAEHGYFIRQTDGTWVRTIKPEDGWQEKVIDFFNSLTKSIPGSFIERKEASVVFHYRTSPVSEDLLCGLKKLVENFRRKEPFCEIMFGNHVIEMKVPGFNKGSVALDFIKDTQFDFLMAIGDDVTDETLFREINGKGFTLKVGDGPTEASFRIPEQSMVVDFLGLLLSIL